MKVLLPESERPAEELLAQLVAAARLPAFAPVSVEFVKAVSAELLADRALRAYPELLALAHWFRPVELKKLQEVFERVRARSPRGVVFHLAPSNVDSMFVYPWFLALLLGNRNVVRVSRRSGDACDVLLASVRRVLARPEMALLRERSLVVTYDHDDHVTAQLSRACDVRVLWGSDETIRRVRSVPLPVRATELAFSDRFSLALFGADAVAALSEPALAELAHRFCNDSLWFDQLACSSPRAVVWLGTPERVHAAQQVFWRALRARATQFIALLQPALAVTRFSSACYASAALGGDCVRYEHDVGLARVQIPRLEPQHRSAHQGAGFFLELRCELVSELAQMLTPEDQTLVHYGIEEQQLELLAQHGLDRIVPVGEALRFETTWDGTDLIQAFTRQCVLRSGVGA